MNQSSSEFAKINKENEQDVFDAEEKINLFREELTWRKEFFPFAEMISNLVKHIQSFTTDQLRDLFDLVNKSSLDTLCKESNGYADEKYLFALKITLNVVIADRTEKDE